MTAPVGWAALSSSREINIGCFLPVIHRERLPPQWPGCLLTWLGVRNRPPAFILCLSTGLRHAPALAEQVLKLPELCVQLALRDGVPTGPPAHAVSTATSQLECGAGRRLSGMVNVLLDAWPDEHS